MATLGTIDIIVLVTAVGIAIAVGLRARGSNDSIESFLLGDRNLPWWAILGSIVATETSTATVLSLPATAYGPTGMKFLQIAAGYIVGRTIVVYFLLPLFFEGKLFSAYTVLDRRFGRGMKMVASALFLIARNLGDGLRLFLAAIVLQKMAGWSFASSAITIGLVTILYTYFGGMRSVVWNDCIQLVIYMIGGVVSVLIITSQIDGGWAAFAEYTSEHGKLALWQLTPPAPEPGAAPIGVLRWLATDPYSVWAAVIGGAVLTLGTHGTDQMMVQRYLSARSQSDAARAVFWSAIVVFVQFALFLFIGVQLSCYYSQHTDVVFEKADEVYAHFIVHSFPKNTGLVGLMLAAILAAAMSTLSSSLNASASAVVNDFIAPGHAGTATTSATSATNPSDADPLRASTMVSLSRWLCVAFGVLQVGIGLAATMLPADSTVVGNALTIAGYSAGLLLGVFSLGVLTRKTNEAHALIGTVGGLIFLLAIQFLLPTTGVKIAWTWYATIGACTTFTLGCLASVALPAPPSVTPSDSIRSDNSPLTRE